MRKATIGKKTTMTKKNTSEKRALLDFKKELLENTAQVFGGLMPDFIITENVIDVPVEK